MKTGNRDLRRALVSRWLLLSRIHSMEEPFYDIFYSQVSLSEVFPEFDNTDCSDFITDRLFRLIESQRVVPLNLSAVLGP